MRGAELTPGNEILERLDTALAASPADETEIVWHEVARTAADFPDGRRPPAPPVRERNLLVRVYERGRVGIHRTGAGTAGELEDAVRQALAQAKVDPPPLHRPPLTPKGPPLEPPPDGHDPTLAALAPEAAAAMLGEKLADDESARLEWAEAGVVVGNSRGLRRAAEVTAAALQIRSGDGGAAGTAAVAARSLAGLSAEMALERARERRGGGTATDAGSGVDLDRNGGDPPALLLAPEAMARLLELLNHHALSARSFHDRTSGLVGEIGQRVIDPALTVTDRPADPSGLPFPFDFFGAAKESATLIEEGVLRTPAADSSLASELGLPALHLAVGPDDARAGNLFLAAGDLDDEALLEAVGDGVRVGWLESLRCFDPPTLRFRARARGLREIRGGALGGALGDRVWEGSLLELLGRVAGVGREAVCLAAGDGVLEAVVAPALALSGSPSSG